MKRVFLLVCLLLPLLGTAQEVNRIPFRYKWTGAATAVFSYDGSYTDSACFQVQMPKGTCTQGVQAPERYASFPLQPEGAVNLTYSPDSTLLAFTRGGNLWVARIADGKETALTEDGSATVYNGYASWVYYEEIFGRPSRYRAFWWSPDSKRLAYYRFDDSAVPMFPIYSPFGQDGALRETRYPKAGEANPEVRIGFVEVAAALEGEGLPPTVWADFDPSEDQYFGTPFWGKDSRTFYISREPRIQNTLDLYAVSALDGSKKPVYHETYPTWLDWIDGMLFSDKGLYMVRSFETGWQQIYFLSYKGELRRLTDGENWRVQLLRADKDGTVYFTAQRDSHVRQALYKVDPKGRITALTDPRYDASGISFSPDGKYFIACISALDTPTQIWIHHTKLPLKAVKVADRKGPDFEKHPHSLGQIVEMEVDGLTLPGVLYFPDNFDMSQKYPVHVDIYGGPDTPLVRDRWVNADTYGWYAENGIIELIADCRAAGHNGRAGLDAVYKQLSMLEVKDFIAWSDWLKALPYVKADKIGVEGFSFGGTMTALLVMTAPEAYPYGIAGGGVYDWKLYDTHYTERFMSTPADNPDGYLATRVIDKVACYPVEKARKGEVMLKLTHGTGDDNVHFQNTLQLIDALQKHNAPFEFMIYPDGMHGYRGYQAVHFERENRAFWLKYLKDVR